MSKKKSDISDRVRSASPQSKKKLQEPEHWQDIVKFQQEITVLQSIESDMDTRLLHLECLLKKFQKNMRNQESQKSDLESHANYYIDQLGKFLEDARKLKIASERKIHILGSLKKDAEQYLKLLKQEQKRHLSVMDEMNAVIINNLEKLKKIDQEEFLECEIAGKPKNIFSKFRRCDTPHGGERREFSPGSDTTPPYEPSDNGDESSSQKVNS